MSAVQAVKDFMKTLHPKKGQSVENFAKEMFAHQIEIYSAHAMQDLDNKGGGLRWDELDEPTKKSWIKTAKKKFPKNVPRH